MQNAEAKEDLRIQRTRKLLQQALFELVSEKGFNPISVRDITRRAMVNRSTFYRHYLDKYDLLNQYMDELQTAVSDAAALAEKTNVGSEEKIPAGLLLLVKHVQAYPDFYRIMLGQNGDAMFTQRFRQMAEKRYRFLFAQLKQTVDPKAAPVEMKIHYMSCASIGAILWWLENQQPCTAEQLAVWLGQLSMTSAGFLPKLENSTITSRDNPNS